MTRERRSDTSAATAEGLPSPVRTRSETIDFLGLVFSIRIDAAARFDTLADVVAATGLSSGRLGSLAACGLIRLDLGGTRGLASADDVRLAAIMGRLSDLGCDLRDLAVLADRPGGRQSDKDTWRGDAIEAVRAILDRLRQAARASVDSRDALRHRRLGDALASIDALADLI